MLSDLHVRALFPAAAPLHLDGFAERAAALFASNGLGQPGISYFLATIGHETQGLTRLEENLDYRAARIVAVWPSRFRAVAAARPFEHAPARLANHVYALRMGNGDEASGDGYKYRGRGYIQLTGRALYRTIGKETGLDLEQCPELAVSPSHALAIALSYWRVRDLAPLSSFEDVCRKVNGGKIGLASRRHWLARVTKTLAA